MAAISCAVTQGRKISIDQTSQSKGGARVRHLTAASFGMHMGGGHVGVAAEKWHDGFTCSKVKNQCKGTGSSPFQCAGTRKCCDNSHNWICDN